MWASASHSPPKTAPDFLVQLLNAHYSSLSSSREQKGRREETARSTSGECWTGCAVLARSTTRQLGMPRFPGATHAQCAAPSNHSLQIKHELSENKKSPQFYF